jgi:hydrogenase expression/formation protein HypC
MCLGAIHVLDAVWDDAGTRVGRLDDGRTVTLGFVPEAELGTYVIVHMGIPVEVLAAEDARAALELRARAGA